MGKELIIKKTFGKIIIDLDSSKVYNSNGVNLVKFNLSCPELNVKDFFNEEDIKKDWNNNDKYISFSNFSDLAKKLKEKKIIKNNNRVNISITDEDYKLLNNVVKLKKDEFKKSQQEDSKKKEDFSNSQHFTFIKFINNFSSGIGNVEWDAEGDPRLNNEVKKVLEGFKTLSHYNGNDIIIKNMALSTISSFAVSKGNINWEYGTYKIPRNQFDKIINLANDIKSKALQNRNSKTFKEIEKWQSKTDIQLAYELYTDSIHVTEDDYFSTCGPYCDDCRYIKVFTRDLVQQLGLNTSKYTVKGHNSKSYTYNLADEQNIKIVAQKKKSEIENYRNKQIENLKKQIK